MLRTLAEAVRRRLVDIYAAPQFSWQNLRRTCRTYLTNAAGIFGAASAYRSTRQPGHSVQVAEKHYGPGAGHSAGARGLNSPSACARVGGMHFAF